VTRARPLAPLARSGAISFEMAARVARGVGCPHASRLPGPDPSSTNSARHQQLYGARSTADYDRGRRQVYPEQ
jgi:hypothetical protein